MTDESNDQKPEKKEAEETKVSSVDVSPKLAKIIEDVEKLSVLELADLVKALEDKFGVSATAMAAAPVASGNGAEGGDAGSAEEKTEFNVVLTETGSSKISVIKAVRELVPSLGLKDAKDLVESAPKPVLEGVGKDAANEAKAKLETAGAKVELK